MVVTPVIDRERGVLTLVGGGLSIEEIAAELLISVATAPTHVSRAMTKLHARDRAQLVVAAYESGLVTPGQRSRARAFARAAAAVASARPLRLAIVAEEPVVALPARGAASRLRVHVDA